MEGSVKRDPETYEERLERMAKEPRARAAETPEQREERIRVREIAARRARVESFRRSLELKAESTLPSSRMVLALEAIAESQHERYLDGKGTHTATCWACLAAAALGRDQ